MSTREKRANKAAKTFRSGRSRTAYVLRRDITKGIASNAENQPRTTGVCAACASLEDLKDVFNSFIHTGQELKRRKKIRMKTGTVYYDLTKQNDFLVRSVFDAKGNYLYHRDCIRAAFGVGSQRLAHLRKCIYTETGDRIESLPKHAICKANRLSDVVMPPNCELPTQSWLSSLPDDTLVQCRKNPRRHGNAKKASNQAKDQRIKEQFLKFVDNNSASNGRKEGSSGKTFYFDRKFTQIRSPDKKDPQFDYKSRHSVLMEFNRTLTDVGLATVSVGTFHNWLKKYRPYVGICPSMSDYCDQCKELEEEISRCQQILNRLIQSGNTPEEKIVQQNLKLLKFREDLQKHKENAQDALDYYRKISVETIAKYTQITTLLEKQKRTDPENSMLQKLQSEYTAFISADYMMSKNLPFWGESPQPAKTYYLMKLVCDIFGIVDHSRQGQDSNYTYLCDELAAGSKNTDHTITFLSHFLHNHVDNWVRNVTFCLDNARICKNKYLLSWANELVNQGQFDSVRFCYMVVGHTKFQPDRLFASIAKSFYSRDVFCIEMLQAIAQLYSTSYVFTACKIFQWRAVLEEKYNALPGITNLHDFIISKVSGYASLKCRCNCYNGLFEKASLKKPSANPDSCNPSSHELVVHKLSAEKLKQLTEQYDKFIKADVDGYIRPSFLQAPKETQPISRVDGSATTSSIKKKRHCSFCNGEGHVQPGKKRHYSDKNCPLRAKLPKH